MEIDKMLFEYCRIFHLCPQDVASKIDKWDYYVAIAFFNREINLKNDVK